MFSAAFALLSLRLRSLGCFVLLASRWRGHAFSSGSISALDMVGAAAVAVVVSLGSKGSGGGPGLARSAEAHPASACFPLAAGPFYAVAHV